uniref:putative keratin-associated protein 4-16 isoform X5 n=1 Tax=Agelaius phoeniceus TaxID=39638 RepID=UPI0023EE2945|nr:putative keratin-associated protein 4-16 isoform X5 [Agelaius phoeniceus]
MGVSTSPAFPAIPAPSISCLSSNGCFHTSCLSSNTCSVPSSSAFPAMGASIAPISKQYVLFPSPAFPAISALSPVSSNTCSLLSCLSSNRCFHTSFLAIPVLFPHLLFPAILFPHLLPFQQFLFYSLISCFQQYLFLLSCLSSNGCFHTSCLSSNTCSAPSPPAFPVIPALSISCLSKNTCSLICCLSSNGCFHSSHFQAISALSISCLSSNGCFQASCLSSNTCSVPPSPSFPAIPVPSSPSFPAIPAPSISILSKQYLFPHLHPFQQSLLLPSPSFPAIPAPSISILSSSPCSPMSHLQRSLPLPAAGAQVCRAPWVLQECGAVMDALCLSPSVQQVPPCAWESSTDAPVSVLCFPTPLG